MIPENKSQTTLQNGASEMKCYFCGEPEPICFDCMDNLLKTAREHPRVSADQAVVAAAIEMMRYVDSPSPDAEKLNQLMLRFEKITRKHPDYKEEK